MGQEVDQPLGENTSIDEVRVTAESFEGPLPAPWILRQYKQTYADAPEIIFGEFQKQGAHRRQEEALATRRLFVLQQVGMLAAYCIVMVAFAIVIAAFAFGYPAYGAAVFSVTSAGIVARFFIGRRNSDS